MLTTPMHCTLHELLHLSGSLFCPLQNGSAIPTSQGPSHDFLNEIKVDWISRLAQSKCSRTISSLNSRKEW